MTPSQAAARRTAIVLASANAILGSAGPIAISMGGLAGEYLLAADKSLATAPVTGFNVGTALATLPAAALVRRFGQRRGLMCGPLFTASGGAVATAALFAGNFWLFALGLALIGAGNAFVQQFRFAAADNAPPEFKARAISFILAGGLVTAVLGPQIVIFTGQLFAPVMFAGSFATLLVLAAVGAAILSRLRPVVVTPNLAQHAEEPARPLREIVMQPRFIIALVCAVAIYALMSFVMTGAPIAMVGCGLTVDDATLGISWHVMAMFGPSFFTGRLIGYFGAERVVAAGLTLLLGCAALSLTGIALWHFWGALILLGLGWNLGFIGATTMVAESYRPSEKNKAQGFHDFALFGSVAVASLMSGAVYNAWGWSMLNWVVLPVVAFCLVLLSVMHLARRQAATA